MSSAARLKDRVDESQLIEAALATVSRPANVKRVEFELGQDSTGEDSVTIWIGLPSDINPTLPTVEKLSDFAYELRQAVFASGVRRFPYVRYRSLR